MGTYDRSNGNFASQEFKIWLGGINARVGAIEIKPSFIESTSFDLGLMGAVKSKPPDATTASGAPGPR
jgi:hypothetical protein